jgi:hypothetical protein
MTTITFFPTASVQAGTTICYIHQVRHGWRSQKVMECMLVMFDVVDLETEEEQDIVIHCIMKSFWEEFICLVLDVKEMWYHACLCVCSGNKRQPPPHSLLVCC